ncbi:MAG: AmmeMemoRadiSam system radical SAM enzyme [Verrucomicrobiae bacterium]|nr:AmmeMemoRadiSam system radical SAM enzyme [Verrucomicrobiae bacterium]
MSITREHISRGVIKAEWWHKLPDGRFQCDLCPRECKIQPGQRGFCFIREATPDSIVLTSYGRASGFCIDPIEKKPLNHFYPGSAVLSFGTAGCNLGCKFCQNWDISKAKAADRLTSYASPMEVAEAALRSGSKSVAFTYNDPVIFAEYAVDCAIEAHKHGVKTVAVTAGYINPLAREVFFEQMDAANVDLKAFTEEFYRKLCYAELKPILETLVWIKERTKTWLEVTTLLIPGYNDSENEIAELSKWFVENLGPDTPLHFTAFHPDFKLIDAPATPFATLRRARQQAKAAGIRHVYTGNVNDVDGQSTYCARCAALLIERNWYEIGFWGLDANGCCKRCGEKLAGHFESQPGNRGRQIRRYYF